MSLPPPGPAADPLAAEQAWRQGPGVLASLWRHRVLVVLVTLLSGVAGYGASLLQPPSFEASARLFLADPRNSDVFTGGSGQSIDPDTYAEQQVALLTSRAVLARASDLLEATPGADALGQRVTAEVETEGGFVVAIRATDPSPRGAADTANAVSEAYQQVVAENALARAEAGAAQLDPSRQAYADQIASLQGQLSQDPDSTVIENQIEQLNAQLLQLESRAQGLLANAAAFGSGVELA